MKTSILTLTLAALVATATVFISCKHLETPTAKSILKITLRLAAYEVAKKNPGIENDLAVITAAIRAAPEFVQPDNVKSIITDAINQKILDPTRRALANDLAALLIDYYATIHAANLATLTDSQYYKILLRLADEIESGINLMPASGSHLYHAGRLILSFN